jgi:polyphosphate kinase
MKKQSVSKRTTPSAQKKKAVPKRKSAAPRKAANTAKTSPKAKRSVAKEEKVDDECVRRFLDSSFKIKKMKRSDYEDRKEELQIELLKVQSWVKKTGRRVVILFEGRDAAGKGGTIKRFMEHMNPRGARVVALSAPDERERSQWYFQRYVQHLPSAGEITLFDRSWYNRAGVERVMGFCRKHEYEEFMRSVPQFEQMLVNSGILLFKYWFAITRKEQLERFLERKGDPLKHWKLSPVDAESQNRWAEYSEAKNAMFQETESDWAPWTVIKSNDKKRARINSMRDFLSRLNYENKDPKIAIQPEPEIVARVADLLIQGQEGVDAVE